MVNQPFETINGHLSKNSRKAYGIWIVILHPITLAGKQSFAPILSRKIA